MSNEYKDWLAEEEKEQRLNKGGFPVKNASYWKRQHDKLKTENTKLREALSMYEPDMKRALSGEQFYPAVFEIQQALKEVE